MQKLRMCDCEVSIFLILPDEQREIEVRAGQTQVVLQSGWRASAGRPEPANQTTVCERRGGVRDRTHRRWNGLAANCPGCHFPGSRSRRAFQRLHVEQLPELQPAQLLELPEDDAPELLEKNGEKTLFTRPEPHRGHFTSGILSGLVRTSNLSLQGLQTNS